MGCVNLHSITRLIEIMFGIQNKSLNGDQDLQEEILKGRSDNLSCALLHDSFELVFVPHK